jgi:histidine ammonia-lyase
MIACALMAAARSREQSAGSPGERPIPTSANKEDHNRHHRRAQVLEIVANAKGHAIELLCAAQGLTFHQLEAGRGTWPPTRSSATPFPTSKPIASCP